MGQCDVLPTARRMVLKYSVHSESGCLRWPISPPACGFGSWVGGAIDFPCTIIQDHLDGCLTLPQLRCECIIATISWSMPLIKIIFALHAFNSKGVAVMIRSSHQGLAIACAMQAAVSVAHQQQCILLVFAGLHAARMVGCSNVIMARPTYADPIVAVAVGPKTVAFRAQTTIHA